MRNRIERRGERYSKYGSTVSDGELHFFNLALCLEHILESCARQSIVDSACSYLTFSVLEVKRNGAINVPGFFALQ